VYRQVRILPEPRLVLQELAGQDEGEEFSRVSLMLSQRLLDPATEFTPSLHLPGLQASFPFSTSTGEYILYVSAEEYEDKETLIVRLLRYHRIEPRTDNSPS
jgi:hypothetical protein